MTDPLLPVSTAGVRSWLLVARRSSGLWAIADQGMVSAGSFFVTILLARNLPASEFGVFGIVLTVLVTAATAQASTIGIPLMVLSANKAQREHLPTVALALTVASVAVFSVALSATSLVLGRPGLVPFAVLALLAGQIQETLRRSLIGRFEFARAAIGDTISYLGQAVGVAALSLTGKVTVERALLIMGLTSALAAGVQFWQVRPMLGTEALRGGLVKPFWRLGKALLVVNGIGVLTIQSFPWLLGALAGVAAVGSYQALLAVVGFTNPLMLAVNSIITTRAALAQGLDVASSRRLELEVARRYGLLGGVPLVAYCVTVFSAPGLILRLFFGAGSTYRGLGSDLRILVLFSLALYAYFVMAGVLNARQDTRLLLRAQVAGALIVPLLGAPLMAHSAVRGAVIAAVISAVVRAFVAARPILRRSDVLARFPAPDGGGDSDSSAIDGPSQPTAPG